MAVLRQGLSQSDESGVGRGPTLDVPLMSYARLSDNTLVYLREIRADDKQRLIEGMRGLSEESVQRRFLGPKPTLSAKELRYLTEVDGVNHIALVAIDHAVRVRATRPGGWILLIDQVAPNDPLIAVELNRFERARDPSHTRALADVDLRQLFESNGLVLVRTHFDREVRDAPKRGRLGD